MSENKRSGLKPLRSSTNIINNKSLSEDRTGLKKSQISSFKEYEPKVSITESIESNYGKSSIKSTKLNQLSPLLKTKKIVKLTKSSKSTNLGPYDNLKQIVKSHQSFEKKKVKKAIKTVLNKGERIKKWLTTKGPVEDSEYWRLCSERLSKELTETLDHLDELELENELLIAELNEMSKLAENACKLSALIKKIDLIKCQS